MSKWSGRTKGTVLGYSIFIFFIRKLGVSVSYFLLYFTVPFYFLFLSEARKNLILTFKEIPNLSLTNLYLLIYENFHNLGKSLIDNFAILTKWGSKYSYSQEGERYLVDLIQKNKPAILISGHIGSWNIAGELLKKQKGVVNVVMYDGEAEKIKNLVSRDIGESNYKIIAIKQDLSHLFKIKLAVDNGELICIHADRFLKGASTIPSKLFTQKIDLPLGPFSIAAKLNIPYTFVFAVKKSKYKYYFSATKPKISNDPKIIADEFSKILADKLSKYPEQWFNYFNIFDTSK
jgi:predicted LPLAT superfamily acyltransferase